MNETGFAGLATALPCLFVVAAVIIIAAIAALNISILRMCRPSSVM